RLPGPRPRLPAADRRRRRGSAAHLPPLALLRHRRTRPGHRRQDPGAERRPPRRERQAAMSSPYPFLHNDRPTLGVELELNLVDAQTMALRSGIADVLAVIPEELKVSV